jgi:hypothetical protein
MQPSRKPQRYASKRPTTPPVIFAVAAGSAQVAQHGYHFFVFRQGGTGSTGGSELTSSS